jgi:thiamine kinase-like enzyme
MNLPEMSGTAVKSRPDLSLGALLNSIPVLAERPVESWHAQPLASLTNRVWRLRSGTLDLVLRVPGHAAQRYLSRSQELHNAGIAARCGIAPDLLYADPASGVAVQRFLEGARPLGAADFASTELAFKVGALLSRLHHAEPPFQGEMSPFPVIDLYLGLATSPRLAACRAAAEPVRNVLERHVPTSVPSHIDPNPANFLLLPDGSLRLIDWEYSAMCEPAWDLAAVTLESAMGAIGSRTAAAALYEGYGMKPGPQELARLWLMRTALHLVAASWTCSEIAGGNAAAGLPDLLEDQLTRLEAKLASPELARALGVLG